MDIEPTSVEQSSGHQPHSVEDRAVPKLYDGSIDPNAHLYRVKTDTFLKRWYVYFS